MINTTHYGTVGGVEITDEVIDSLVENAEAGFPGVTRAVPRAALRWGSGRQPRSQSASTGTSTVHVERVEGHHTNALQIIRDALRSYLHAA